MKSYEVKTIFCFPVLLIQDSNSLNLLCISMCYGLTRAISYYYFIGQRVLEQIECSIIAAWRLFHHEEVNWKNGGEICSCSIRMVGLG